tara:strand:+ start:499 stop:1428 length:930 start_codon:yes stop_codon:yes gene_type:complete
MIIVTGGAGFIGSNLIRQYNLKGYNNFLIVDNLNKKFKRDNLKKLKFSKIISKNKFREKIKKNNFRNKIRAIYHLGANTNTINKDKNFLIDNNFKYSVEILNLALKNNCKFLYASSMSVYGRSKIFLEVPKNEKPINYYSKSKLLFDNYVRKTISLNNKCKIIGLRFFNVFGSGERHKKKMASSIYQFYQENKKHKSITLFKYSKKKISRDFIYIDDCIKICIWLEKKYNKSIILNVGSGVSTTYIEIAQQIINIMKFGNLKFIEIPNYLKKQYQFYSRANIKNLRQIGYKYKFTNIRIAIKEYIKKLK